MKRLALTTVVVLLTLAAIAVIWRLRSTAIVFVLALTIAATVEGPIQWLVTRKIPRALALLLAYVSALLVILGLGTLTAVPTLSEVDPFVRDMATSYGEIQSRLQGLGGGESTWTARLPTTEQLVALISAEASSAAEEETEAGVESGPLDAGTESAATEEARGIVLATQNLAGIASQLALAIVLAIYWSAGHMYFERLWLSILAPDKRMQARAAWRKLYAHVGAFIRSELLQVLLAGALFAGGGWLMGLKYPFLLAFLASIAWLIPLLGGALATVVAFIIGWLSGPVMALSISAYVILVLVAFEFLLKPLLYRHERFWGLAVIPVMLAMGDEFGLFGLIFAPPVAIAIQIIVSEVFRQPRRPLNETAELALSDLHARLDAIRDSITTESEQISPRLSSFLERLEEVVDEAQHAQGDLPTTPDVTVPDTVPAGALDQSS